MRAIGRADENGDWLRNGIIPRSEPLFVAVPVPIFICVNCCMVFAAQGISVWPLARVPSRPGEGQGAIRQRLS